ncbi:MAG: hypothetical protein EOR47_25245 [Mesorhizobium sp.]|uniref:maleate cis-trans isomerase family protein n=1 Tax=Mesorhizobium sp. TaxID=1871066 RepID=UPI000FE4A714|nr:hypothetical protein [Mesorhizobium sp.]RWK46659.1 MAG: hypothetical protein EOR47_25245 [Mesorhizobium sp.]
MKTANAPKKIGAILPDWGYPYEITDEGFINKWLADRNVEGAEYIVLSTPNYTAGMGVSELEFCKRAAAEEILSAAARQLGNNGCSSIFWGCTSASFFGGLQYAQRQIRLLSENAGVPASSASMALLAALDVLGAKRVDVLAPYGLELTKLFVTFLSDAGVSVGNIRRYSPRGRDYDSDCEAELERLVSSTPFSDDPIVIPCTGLNSLQRVESFEKISSRLVITANQATLWHALALAGLTPSIADSGSFFTLCAQMNGGALRLPLQPSMS